MASRRRQRRFALGLRGVNRWQVAIPQVPLLDRSGAAGELRVSAGDRDTWSARTSIELPLDLSVSVDYSWSTYAAYDVRSHRSGTTRGWPNLGVRLTELPVPEGLRGVLTRASAGSGYRRTVQLSSFGVGGLQMRRTTDSQVPIDVSVTLLGTLSTSYRGLFSSGKSVDPTGDTRRNETSHNLSLLSSLTAPPLLRNTFPAPLQASIRYSFTAQRNCRRSSVAQSCVAFIDQINRALNLSLDTTLSDMNVGVQLSYTSRQSFVGQRGGNSQFQLGFFGQFLFSSGTVR